MSNVLDALGLTPEEVRKAFGVDDPGEKEEEAPKRYLFSGDQRRMRRRMARYHGFILARFLEGFTPKIIAQLLTVSEEAVRSRLRKEGMFKGKGKPGRPRKTLSRESYLSES